MCMPQGMGVYAVLADLLGQNVDLRFFLRKMIFLYIVFLRGEGYEDFVHFFFVCGVRGWVGNYLI